MDEGGIVDELGAGYFFAYDLSDNDYTSLTSVQVGLKDFNGFDYIDIIDNPDKTGVVKITNKLTQKFVIIATDIVGKRIYEYDISTLKLSNYLRPLNVSPVSPNETVKHAKVSDIQSQIVINDSQISGTLKALSGWVWDTFSFDHGVVGDAPYHYIALDLSNNIIEFNIVSIVIYSSSAQDDRYDILNNDSKVLLSVSSNNDVIFIVQTSSDGSKNVQKLDLTNVTLL